jgi:hypothetical protein
MSFTYRITPATSGLKTAVVAELPARERGRIVSELIRSLEEESIEDPASVDTASSTK